MCTARKTWALGLCVLVWLVPALTADVCADGVPDLKEQLRLIQEQNDQLQQQLLKQQRTIDNLSRRLSAVEGANQKRGEEIGTLKTRIEQQAPAPVEQAKPFSLGKVILSGEGALAFFDTGTDGQFPNNQFQVDEARLFLDAQVWNDVYFFGGVDITTREISSQNLRINELYVDFESVSRLWGDDRQFNLRLGQFYTPFGEEYQYRYAIDDPLISHSLSDIWGVDDGVEAYGSHGKFDYALAVQNGGMPGTQHHADKSVAGRVGFDPTKWLRISGSAMRTGNLNNSGDKITALWFGNGFFKALGSPATTTSFHADLAEGDVQLKLPLGYLKAAGGYVFFDDNDTSADNARNVYYYYVEGLYDITSKLYGAARFSEIIAPGGYPIVGQSNFSYFGEMTKRIWRLSADLGYRFSKQLVLKAEYSLEHGREADGEDRDHEDQVALQLAYQF